MDWFRSHHGAPSDPKWLVVARKAKVAPALVVATFWMLLDHASQHQSRGSIQGFDVEVAATFLGIEDSEVGAILAAMRDRGVIIEERLSNWEKRQPKREDDSKERVRNHRNARKESETQGAETGGSVTQSVDVVTPINADVTQCNATVTHGNDRTEQNRTEQSRAEQREEEREQSADAPMQGKTVNPQNPLPLVVQNFIDSKGRDANRWERELRLELSLVTLQGDPARYMSIILKRWEREGLPQRTSAAAPNVPVADPNAEYRRQRREIAERNRRAQESHTMQQESRTVQEVQVTH